MKRVSFLASSLLLISLLGFISCSENEEATINERSGELRIAPSIVDRTEPETRGPANNFFTEGDSIRVVIQSSRPGSSQPEFLYIYDENGIFVGDPIGYKFPLDDSYITTLKAEWPENAASIGGFIPDQREYENFRRADWLVASATASGVMATDIPVPLYFTHNNCLLEFELVGQNTSGLEITELVLELEVDGVPTACWAYCGNENGRASLLLKEGTVLEAQEATLIGSIPGASSDRYTIILSDIYEELEAGKRYLVTLTPRGFDMDIFVFIGTFFTSTEERETGIGVPFHLPEQGESGDYIIRTPIQLVTVSYVVRHYTDGSTPDYPSATYVLTDDFQMTEEVAGLYVPIPASEFSGSIILNDQAVTSLPYGNGGTLQLFTNN